MNKRMVIRMLGTVFLCAIMTTACGKKNEATQASVESEATEKEGTGEADADKDKDTQEEEVIRPQIAVLLDGSVVDERMQMDAAVFQDRLEGKGYQAVLRYAGGSTVSQEEQINSIASQETPVEAMIISPVDVYALSEALEKVYDQKIPVFCYDELIMNTNALDYFVTFDTRSEGQALGKKIIEANGLEKAEEDQKQVTIHQILPESRTIGELFLKNGTEETLEPYFENRTLVESRTQPEVILTLDCGDAVKAVEQLHKRGRNVTDPVWPQIYTAGNDLDAIRMIASGEITGTWFTDSRRLAEACCDAVLTLLSGETPEISDYEQYDNGLRLVRTITCEAEYVDADDYHKLTDSGYYKSIE